MKGDKKTSNSSTELTSAADPQLTGQLQHTSGMGESRAAIDKVIGSAHKIIRIFDRDLSDPGRPDPVSNDFEVWNGKHETASPVLDSSHGPEDLLLQVPGENEKIIGLCFEYLRRGEDGDAHAWHE